MAKSARQITIFISGTSETDSEKNEFLLLADRLDRIVQAFKKTNIKVIKWPDNITPGVNTYPQKEIQRQLKDQYQIYLGLLGARFGSPTPNAKSGTEEEFNQAISKFRNDTTSTRVLFYFKRFNENVLKIDTDQLTKVQEFHKKLPTLGVLYKEFEDKPHFLKMVEDDLINLIASQWQEDKWELVELEQFGEENIPETTSKKIDVKTTENYKSEFENNSSDPDKVMEHEEMKNEDLGGKEQDKEDGDGDEDKCGDEGKDEAVEGKVADEESEDNDFYLLDTIRDLHKSNDSMIENIDQIGQYTRELGNNVSFQSGEIKNIMSKMAATGNVGGSRESQKMVSVASEILDKIAVEMETYSKKLNPHVSKLPTEINTFLENYSKLYKYQRSRPNQENEEIEEAFDTLESFVRTMIETKNVMMDSQDSIVEIPAFTRKFKRAKKRAADSIGQLVAALTIGINKGQEILSDLDQYSS